MSIPNELSHPSTPPSIEEVREICACDCIVTRCNRLFAQGSMETRVGCHGFNRERIVKSLRERTLIVEWPTTLPYPWLRVYSPPAKLIQVEHDSLIQEPWRDV